jgi:hypothetical protein
MFATGQSDLLSPVSIQIRRGDTASPLTLLSAASAARPMV